ncbi:MAG TPA: SpoIID/LytB domain-containing protein [Syntrophales bacterium]|nr:SpoIID/LytB domain-containing protein [Syntrophales bacterium]
MIQFILLFTIILGLTSDGIAYNANQFLEEADMYLRDGQYLEALKAYQDISDLSPDPEMKARAELKMGDIYSEFLNDRERALERYTVVIKKYGSSKHAANAYFNSGMILYEKNRYKDALHQFNMYIKKYPNGYRREAAEFMVEICSKPPPTVKQKKTPFKKAKDGVIRVLIMAGIRDVHVDSPSWFEVRDGDERETLIKVRAATIGISGGVIRLNDREIPQERLVIVPSDNMLSLGSDSFKGKFKLQRNTDDRLVIVPTNDYDPGLKGNPYRGKIRLQKNKSGGMDVINVLDVEEYLYGVIPKEMSPQWHPEALKAQAIAARTLALEQKEKSKDRDYDIVAATTFQVYGGSGVESGRSNQAVDETKGMVLLYNGQLALAYFHANSGGMTEDAKRVWSTDVPYLKTVWDGYSMKAPNCLWTLYLSLDKIKNALNSNGFEIGSIEKLVPVEVSPSGRIMKIKIFHSGKEAILNGNDFRTRIDPTLIKSTLFTIVKEGDEIRLDGRGYGHGVGMSQWGANVMANEGYSYSDILKHYYQGVEIR